MDEKMRLMTMKLIVESFLQRTVMWDRDEPISGSDAVDLIAEFRIRFKKAVKGI